MMQPGLPMCPVLAVTEVYRPFTRGDGHGGTSEEVLQIPQQDEEHTCRDQSPRAQIDVDNQVGQRPIDRQWTGAIETVWRQIGQCQSWKQHEQAPHRQHERQQECPEDQEVDIPRRFSNRARHPRGKGARAPSHERRGRRRRNDQGSWWLARGSRDHLMQ